MTEKLLTGTLSLNTNKQTDCPHLSGQKLKNIMSQHMRLWYLSDRGKAKAQMSLGICAVSPELFAHMKYGRRRRVQPKISHLAALAPLDGLKNEFMEDEKCHNLMSWLLVCGKLFCSGKYLEQHNAKIKYRKKEPQHVKTNNMAYLPSKDSGQPVHPPALISLCSSVSG